MQVTMALGNRFVAFRPSNDAEVVTHEINHTLGNVYNPGGGVLQEGVSSRGINEAITEKLAQEICGEDFGSSAYEGNVKLLKEIIRIVDSAGYKNADAISYYTAKTDYLANAVNKISGDKNFYNELVKNMDINDQVRKFGVKKILEAQGNIYGLIYVLQNKVGG